jgi:hypothetical protein
MCIPDELKPSLTPLLETISHLNKQIYSLDKAIESTAQNRYLAAESPCLRECSQPRSSQPSCMKWRMRCCIAANGELQQYGGDSYVLFARRSVRWP